MTTAGDNRNFAKAPDSTASFLRGCTCHWHLVGKLRIASNADALKYFAHPLLNPGHNDFDYLHFFGL